MGSFDFPVQRDDMRHGVATDPGLHAVRLPVNSARSRRSNPTTDERFDVCASVFVRVCVCVYFCVCLDMFDVCVCQCVNACDCAVFVLYSCLVLMHVIVII